MRDLDEGCIYLEHLRLEHRHLHEAMRGTREVLLECETDGAMSGWREVILEHLTAFRAQLVQHFRQEEEGGCLEEALVRVPRLSHVVRQLEIEHPILLTELDAIIQRCASAAAQEITSAFQGFTLNLAKHEASELRVMADAFGCGVSDESDQLGEF